MPDHLGSLIVTLEFVRIIAKSHGLPTKRRSKAELIKSIQVEEGDYACYATAYAGVCAQRDCPWRDDCFAVAQSGG